MNRSYSHSTLSVAALFLGDDLHRTGMARMPRLGVVEDGDPHVEILAWHEVLVVLAAGDQVAARNQRPMAVGPVRRTLHVVAVAFVLAADDDGRGDRGGGNLGVLFLGVGDSLLGIHPPDRTVVHASAGLRIPHSHLAVDFL